MRRGICTTRAFRKGFCATAPQGRLDRPTDSSNLPRPDLISLARETAKGHRKTIWTAQEVPADPTSAGHRPAGRHQGGRQDSLGKNHLDSLRGTREAGKGSLDSLRGTREAGKDQFNSLRGTREGPGRQERTIWTAWEAPGRHQGGRKRGACATRAKAQRPERRVLGIRVTIYMASALPGMVPPQGWCQARGCLPGKPPPPLAGGCRLGPHGARPGRALLFRV